MPPFRFGRLWGAAMESQTLQRPGERDDRPRKACCGAVVGHVVLDGIDRMPVRLMFKRERR